jgi:excisionase family DNA binding protein
MTRALDPVPQPVRWPGGRTWLEEAACAQEDTELFFGRDRKSVRAAPSLAPAWTSRSAMTSGTASGAASPKGGASVCTTAKPTSVSQRATTATRRQPAETDGGVVDKLLLTAEEAAEVLGIGRSKVYELIASHRLQSVKIGASRRIPADAVAAFVRELRASA